MASSKSAKVQLNSGGTVEVETNEASNGEGFLTSAHYTSKVGVQSTTVTCTCYDHGNSWSTTKSCPNGNNTCDCTTPSSPTISCG